MPRSGSRVCNFIYRVGFRKWQTICMEWDVFEFSLLIIRFYKDWNGQVSCLEVSVKTKIQFCLKHYPNQAKWGRKHHQFFDPNLEVCLIHLCPVKTTTLWAWQRSCNQRKNISAKQNWSSGYFFSSSLQFCTFCMVMDNFIFCWHSKGTRMNWAYKVKFFIFKSRHRNTSSPYKSLQTSIATETLHTSLFTFLALKELENLKKFLPYFFFFFERGAQKFSMFDYFLKKLTI